MERDNQRNGCEDRREHRELGKKIDSMVLELSRFPESEQGNLLYTHLHNRIKEMEEEKRELKADMREFPVKSSGL